jgi:hypothetical protein
VLNKFRRTGVGELIQLELMINAQKLGVTGAEFSWILEDNLLMRTALEKMGASAYRTYRLYDVPTGAATSA